MVPRFLLRPVHDCEMAMIYRWRNEPCVRAVMPYAGEIDFNVHTEWWPKAAADRSRRMLILEDTGMPVAAVVFLDLRPRISAKWGFYTAPHREISKQKSVTAWLTCEVAAIFYGFEYLGLETLYCETIENNTAVGWLNDRIGFETTGNKIFVNDRPPFIEKKLTRDGYEKRRSDAIFARLDALAVEPDPRDRQTNLS